MANGWFSANCLFALHFNFGTFGNSGDFGNLFSPALACVELSVLDL
jgi:hypothetical protein